MPAQPTSAAQLNIADLAKPIDLLSAPAPDAERFVAKGARPTHNITMETRLPDGSTLGSHVDALAKDINGRMQMSPTPHGPFVQTGN